MDNPMVTDDGTRIAILSGEQHTTPESAGIQTFRHAYSQLTDESLPPWETVSGLVCIHPGTKQRLLMDASTALELFRFLDLYKEDLEMMVYDQLEQESEVSDER